MRNISGTMRILLFMVYSPIRDISTPRNPAKTPLVRPPLESAAITVMAKQIIRNFSTAENLIATFARTGVSSASTASEIKPPNSEAVMPIFSARSPSPRRAIGCPSKPVQTEDGVPGILMRIAGIKPPEMPPT